MLVVEPWRKKVLVLLSLLLFHLCPHHALPFSVPPGLALARFPHHIPSPLYLPGRWCWVPGVVTVRSGIVIDREAFSPPVLELLLLAEDIGLLNGTADLLITILDDNDNWPTFSPAVVTVHLLENCPPGRQGSGPSPQTGGVRVWGLEPHSLETEIACIGEKDGQQGGRRGGQETQVPLPSLLRPTVSCIQNKIIKICSLHVPVWKD